jgi:molybdenum cofactor guanylyltransferase
MVNGIVLAGGSSSRMGRNKAIIELLGVPLLICQIEKLQLALGHSAEIMVSVREPGELILPRNSRYVKDLVPNEGPVMGLHSCLQEIDEGHVLLLGVDLPRMDPLLLRELIKDIEPGIGVIPGYLESDFFEPMAAVYPVELRGLLADYLKSGGRSFQELIRIGIKSGHLRKFEIPTDQVRKFMNVNCPEDLMEFSKE